MRVAWLQHVDFEGLGCMAPLLAQRGHEVTATRLYAGEQAPPPERYDALIVMGGPMSVGDEAEHPWLRDEKRAMAAALAADKRVLGICLGSQLLADVLGARVTRNAHQEIGWFPVRLNDAGRSAAAFAGLPEHFMAFHWHGDTWALPAGAQQLISSEACAHQAFSYGDKVVALQFHLEVTAADAKRLFAQGEPAPDRYVQPAAEVLRHAEHFAANTHLMRRLLDNWLT